MAKVVFANELSIDGRKAEHFGSAGPGFWFQSDWMEKLLLGSWHAALQLGDASEFVEVIRVQFEQNKSGVSHHAITDVAFEVVLVDPFGSKRTEVVVRMVPETIERPNGAQMVTSLVLGTIAERLKPWFGGLQAECNRAQSVAEHLAKKH